MTVMQRHLDLVPLLPRFLMVRRAGFGRTGLQHWLQISGVERPAFFLLMYLVQETDPGEALSRQETESRMFNPYTTFNPVFDFLPSLVEKGHLSLSNARYLVTPEARTLIEQTELAARDYLATLNPLPLPELTYLAATLEKIAERLWQADEPRIKAHQARAHRLPPITTTAPMVHLEAAIFALWMARDDAHIAAWRAKGLSGPHLDILTRIWTGEVQSLAALTIALQSTQRSEDVVQGVTVLSDAGYVYIDGERLTLSDAGRQVRDWIEEETDRVYFTPWPNLSTEELDRLYTLLEAVCNALRT